MSTIVRPGISPGFHYRLRQYIQKKHGSINAFCRAVGIKYPAQMTPYLSGKCTPGKKMIERLEMDGADIQWILNGNVQQQATTMLGETLMLSRYRMDIDTLFLKVRLHVQRFSDLYKPCVDAYAVLDHDKSIVDLSGSLENFLGYPQNTLTGMNLKSIMHPEDYRVVQRALEKETRNDAIVTFTSKFKKHDGSYITTECSLAMHTKPMSDLSEYAMILKSSDS
ncbi:MAG: PAS domain-containing protein [Chlorobiaceae bacterium]|nr:PAS domain-containing protein [Chlorobiaceae bacterium]